MTLWCNELLSFHVGFSAVAIILMRLNSWLSTLYCPVFSFLTLKLRKMKRSKPGRGYFVHTLYWAVTTHETATCWSGDGADSQQVADYSRRTFPRWPCGRFPLLRDVCLCTSCRLSAVNTNFDKFILFYRLREPILQSLRTVAEGLIGYNSPNRPKPELIWTKLGI